MLTWIGWMRGFLLEGWILFWRILIRWRLRLGIRTRTWFDLRFLAGWQLHQPTGHQGHRLGRQRHQARRLPNQTLHFYTQAPTSLGCRVLCENSGLPHSDQRDSEHARRLGGRPPAWRRIPARGQVGRTAGLCRILIHRYWFLSLESRLMWVLTGCCVETNRSHPKHGNICTARVHNS